VSTCGRINVPCQYCRKTAYRRVNTCPLEELHIERLQLPPSDVGVERPFEPPEIGQTAADLSFGGGQNGELEHRMVLEQADEALADRPGRADDGDGQSAHASVPPGSVTGTPLGASGR